jgi:hypothetical protein
LTAALDGRGAGSSTIEGPSFWHLNWRWTTTNVFCSCLGFRVARFGWALALFSPRITVLSCWRTINTWRVDQAGYLDGCFFYAAETKELDETICLWCALNDSDNTFAWRRRPFGPKTVITVNTTDGSIVEGSAADGTKIKYMIACDCLKEPLLKIMQANQCTFSVGFPRHLLIWKTI